MYTYIQKISLYIFGAIIYIVSSIPGYTQEVYNYEYYFKKYNIQVVHNPAVDLTFPVWAQPNPEQNITDLSYRVYDVLPFGNKAAEMYIVYPEHGIVVPVLTPNREDQQLIAEGKMFDHYKYLEKGALYYYGESPDHGASNMVVAAHSSFQKDQPGDYKTVFQALPISREGDKVFVYIHNTLGTYDFYEYTIIASAETDMYNTNILKEQRGKYLLTTYGCYDIGTNDKRWYNTAELSNKIIAQSDLRVHAAAPQEIPTIKEIQEKPKITKRIIDTPIITNIPTHDSAPLSNNTSSPIPAEKKSTLLAKAKNIYALLKARNQYVIADTQPTNIIQQRLAARLQKTTSSTTSAQSHTLTIYNVMVAKAKNNPSLAMKVAQKLEILIPKLEKTPGKESQATFMKTLLEALQPYIATEKTTQEQKDPSTIENETSGLVTVLANGKRFIAK